MPKMSTVTILDHYIIITHALSENQDFTIGQGDAEVFMTHDYI